MPRSKSNYQYRVMIKRFSQQIVIVPVRYVSRFPSTCQVSLDLGSTLCASLARTQMPTTDGDTEGPLTMCWDRTSLDLFSGKAPFVAHRAHCWITSRHTCNRLCQAMNMFFAKPKVYFYFYMLVPDLEVAWAVERSLWNVPGDVDGWSRLAHDWN